MHYDTTSVRSSILSARAHYTLFRDLSESYFAKIPGGKRGAVQGTKKYLEQLEIGLSCDLCAAQVLAEKANPAEDVLAYEKAMAHLAAVRALASELRLGDTARDYRAIWGAIVARLDRELPNWREKVDGIGQLPAVRRRAAGHAFTDAEILEAFVKGALSGICGKWGNVVEPALPYLPGIFHGFDLPWLASVPNVAIVLAQLNAVGVNGPWLAGRLVQLLGAARVLHRRTERFGSVENYFQELLADYEGNAVKLGIALGTGSRHKLPGFGIPTAAEALKNCGFDLAKPDIHVNRALASLYIAGFPDLTSDYDSPKMCTDDRVYVMLKMRDVANCVGVETVLVDNAIWLLCSDQANGGLHLPNGEIEELGFRA